MTTDMARRAVTETPFRITACTEGYVYAVHHATGDQLRAVRLGCGDWLIDTQPTATRRMLAARVCMRTRSAATTIATLHAVYPPTPDTEEHPVSIVCYVLDFFRLLLLNPVREPRLPDGYREPDTERVRRIRDGKNSTPKGNL